MQKKIFFSVTILAIITFFSISTSFANSNMVNDAVNTTEGGVNTVVNGVEDAGQAVGNFVGDVGHAAGNIVEDVVNGAGSLVEDGKNTLESGANATSNTLNSATSYTAQRTSADNGTFLGMNADAWSWIIVGVFGIAIVALVLFYGNQHSNAEDNNYHE